MNEIAIREKLQQFLEIKHRKDDAVFIHELQVDNANRRADLVMANGKLCAFEIKSEFDSLDRLPGQIETYMHVFEQVVVVSASKHVKNIKEILPKGVGLFEFIDGKFKQIIRPKTNSKLSSLAWATHLTSAELKILLRENNINYSGIKSELIDRVKEIPTNVVKVYTLNILKKKFPKLLEARANKKAEHKADCVLPQKLIGEPHIIAKKNTHIQVIELRHQRHQKMFEKFGESYEYLP
ncbi:sce7726 family protein [Neisseria sp. 74A18]|uniref:sce7726 family protein n=1 Tax=Neisseria sp. 74A18 TaxID=1696094 RepID=UPI000AB7451F|nr:sce7726 family protein [Neisseria sp. 74A18]